MSKIWHWEETNPNHSGASGDLSKQFKNERMKIPGLLSVGAPSPEATVLAREAVQNAWDAARELRSDLLTDSDSSPPPFDMHFDFRQATGGDKSQLVSHLGLPELDSRLDNLEDGRSIEGKRHSVGLRKGDCLDSLKDNNSALKYLLITERGTCGMHGPWKGDKSKLFLALLSIGLREGVQGSGGSFGYGKAGLIQGSAIRTIIAYTCFREREDDPKVTRRLLGVVYWGQHRIGDESFTGFARYGNLIEENMVVPFENEKADEIAISLGMVARDPSQDEDLGTTMLLVEPTIEPQDLLVALERNWWPALEDKKLHFNLTVSSVKDDTLHPYPRPKQNKSLKAFIEGYDIALTPQDNRHKDKKQYTIKDTHSSTTLGKLGLVADLEGWSYADQTEIDNYIEHRSLVAFVRNPRMVVEYYVAGQTPPYIRGTFVADEKVNDKLRDTEPKAHDEWQTNLSQYDINYAAADVAKQITEKVKQRVGSFRRELKPEPRPPEDVELPLFDQIMKRILSGKGGTKQAPESEQRDFSITYKKLERQVIDDNKIGLYGTVRVAFSENCELAAAIIKVSIFYKYIEEGRIGSSAGMVIQAPDGFEEDVADIGSYIGTLAQGEELIFDFETEAYPDYRSGRLFVDAVIEDMP